MNTKTLVGLGAAILVVVLVLKFVGRKNALTNANALPLVAMKESSGKYPKAGATVV